jgi:hypothetical protein
MFFSYWTNDPTRRHFVSSGSMCNAQYFEPSVSEELRKGKDSVQLTDVYASLMRRRIYARNAAVPAACDE